MSEENKGELFEEIKKQKRRDKTGAYIDDTELGKRTPFEWTLKQVQEKIKMVEVWKITASWSMEFWEAELESYHKIEKWLKEQIKLLEEVEE